MRERPSRAPLVAYVLHHHDWSESSLILDLFTREQGRLVVVAKGAKRPYSQLRSVLLPFQRLSVQVGTKKGEEQAEVRLLRSAEWAGGPPMLSGGTVLTGFYLNELLIKALARDDPHPRLFDAYAMTLPVLARGDDAEVQAALRAFELVLLRDMGVLPDLGRITQTLSPVQGAALHLLRPEVGVSVQTEDEFGIPGASLHALQAALDTGELAGVRQACLAVLPELKTQLRALLHYHLGTSRLRTRQVMLDVQRLLA